LDTKEFLRKQQETKILEAYNLINGAKLWYQMMPNYMFRDTKWCEPRDHMVTQRTRKDTNSRKSK
jgi:hypothetical protein